MAINLINIGNVANDGTGDDLREAMIKINQNFEELDLRDDEQTTARNLGFGSTGIFAQKLNYDLQFKGLYAGTDVTLSATDTGITINADGGIKDITLSSDANSRPLADTDTVKIAGGSQIATTIIDDILYVSYTGPIGLSQDTAPTLSTDLDAANYNIENVAVLDAVLIQGDLVGNVTGNVTGLVHDVDIRDLDNDLNQFDNGGIIPNVTNILQYIISTTDVDFGSFNTPSIVESDFGTLV